MKKLLLIIAISSSIISSQVRYAAEVVDFSTQYSPTYWSASKALGAPDVYPNYGDLPNAWASATSDGMREHLVLSYNNPSPISYVAIYETFNPGAVDTIYVKNPNTGQWVIVWSGTAQSAGNVSRIFQVSFPMTSFNVSEVRIAINSPAVPGWNEIDAVGISDMPVTSTEYENLLPLEFSLAQNFPNPFNPSTTISFSLPTSVMVNLTVYDAFGNQVAQLLSSELPAGNHSVLFDATHLSSGTYFYKITAGSFVSIKKMLLMK